MNDTQPVIAAAKAVADAISRRDVVTIERLLAPDFVLRSPGGETRDIRAFLSGIADIPGEIVSVRLSDLTADVAVDGALVTGIQHARVRIGGQEIDDRRSFVDWFVRLDGKWKIRTAVDLPAPADAVE